MGRNSSGRASAASITADDPQRLLGCAAESDQSEPRRPGISSVNLSYPIGASPADANARTRAHSAAADGRTEPPDGAADCHRGAPTPRFRWTRIASGCRRPWRRASLPQRRLDAEQSRFDVGLSTNFFVVQAQRDFATRQNARAACVLLDYRRAQVEFARVQEVPTAGSAVVQRDQRRNQRGQHAARRRQWRRLRRRWQLDHDGGRRVGAYVLGVASDHSS